MAATYVGVSGVNRKITKIPVGVGGVNRNCKAAWAGVAGVNRQVFASNNMSSISNASSLGGRGNGKISCSGNVITVVNNVEHGSTSNHPALGIKGIYEKTFSVGDHTAQITISNFTYEGSDISAWVWASINLGDRDRSQGYDPTCKAIADAGGVFTYTFTVPVKTPTNELILRFPHSVSNTDSHIRFDVLAGNVKIDGQPILYPDFSYDVTYDEL